MQGVYRKRVNNLIAEIMLETGKRLGLIDRDSAFYVYDVSDNSVVASATTPQRLYSQLLIKRLELVPLLEDNEVEEQVNPFEEFNFEDLE